MSKQIIAANNLGSGFELDLPNQKINVQPIRMTKIVMVDSSMDYATTVEKTTPWGTSFAIDDGVITHASSDEYLVTGSDKRIMVSGGISLVGATGSTARDNTLFRLQVKANGSSTWNDIGPNFQNNYMRDMSGHNEVSQNFAANVFQFQQDDLIRMRHKQISGSGGTGGGAVRREAGVEAFLLFMHYPNP